MIRLTSEILIDQYRYNGVTDVAISSSWDNLTDTCTLTFPRKLEWKGKSVASGENPILKRGQKVTVNLGYDDDNQKVFEGYVKEISPNVPLVIKCEDAAWLLKQGAVTKSYKDATLQDVLTDSLGILPFEAPAVRLGPLRISNQTPAQVVDYLKKKYFLKAFFRDGKLYMGFAYWPELQSRHRIRFDLHVIQNELEYRRTEDIKIKLKIISVGPDNRKEEYEFGDPDGEQRTYHYYDKKADEINHIASQELERLKYTGYRGKATIFGYPQIRHGDIAELGDPFFPEKDGSYIIKSVDTNFGMNGFRQTIEPEILV